MFLAGGCVENETVQLYVLGNMYMDRDMECVLKEQTSTMAMNPIGTMDLLTTQRYFLFPIAENGMQGLEATTGQTAEDLHLETMGISLLGAWVSFEVDGLKGPYWSKDLNGDGELSSEENRKALEKRLDTGDLPSTAIYELPKQIYVPTSGLVPANESSPVILEAIPSYIGDFLDADMAFDKLYSGGYIRLHVVLHGKMGDGSEVKAREFVFPVFLCRGCLVSYQVSPATCCDPLKEPLEDDQIPCHPAEDDGTPCQIVCGQTAADWERGEAKRQMLLQKISRLSEYVGTGE